MNPTQDVIETTYRAADTIASVRGTSDLAYHVSYDGMRLILDIFGQTLQTLWAHKLRSFLTMFGIAWGVGSLLLLVGLGEGFRPGTSGNSMNWVEDVMFIWGGRAPTMDGSFNSLRQYYLTDRDYRDIATNAPTCAPSLQTYVAMTSGP